MTKRERNRKVVNIMGRLKYLPVIFLKSLWGFISSNYTPILFWAGCVFAGNIWKFGVYLFPNAESMHHYVVSQSFSGCSVSTSLYIFLQTSKTKVASKAMMFVILIMSIYAFIGSMLNSMGIKIDILSQVEGVKDVWLEHVLFFTIFVVGYSFYILKDKNNALEIPYNDNDRGCHISDNKICCMQKTSGNKAKIGDIGCNSAKNKEYNGRS